MTFKVHMLAFANGKVREVRVPDEELNGSEISDLEKIFYYGQNDFQPQSCPSVSVGDVVEYGGEFHMVCMDNWKKISKKELVEYQKMDADQRWNFQHPQ